MQTTIIDTIQHVAVKASRLRVCATAGAVLALGTLGLTSRLAAQETQEQAKSMADKLFFENGFPIDEENPESKIPSLAERNKYPVEFGMFLMSLGIKAEDAEQGGDFAGAAKYYRAIVAAVPDRSAGFSKLCAAYRSAGDRAKAEQACGAALLREGVTVNDYVEYGHLVIEQRAPLSATQVKHLDDVIAHLREQKVAAEISTDLSCQLALRLKDEARLKKCTTELVKLKPNDMKTIWYQWILAIKRLDRRTALGLVARAKQTDASPEVIRGMEDASLRLRSPLQQAIHQALPALTYVAAALVLLSAFAWFRRREMQALMERVLRKSNARVR